VVGVVLPQYRKQKEPWERQMATGLCWIVSLICGTMYDGVIVGRLRIG